MDRDDLKAKGILIVDDDPDLCLGLAATLRSHAFTNIRLAGDGEECLRVLATSSSDVYVVTLGLNMPGMSGLEVVRRLTEFQKEVLGIIMITGSSSWWSVADEFLGLGTETVLTVDFLLKPYNREELLDDVRMILEFVHLKRLGQTVPSILEEKLRQKGASTKARLGRKYDTF